MNEGNAMSCNNLPPYQLQLPKRSAVQEIFGKWSCFDIKLWPRTMTLAYKIPQQSSAGHSGFLWSITMPCVVVVGTLEWLDGPACIVTLTLKAKVHFSFTRPSRLRQYTVISAVQKIQPRKSWFCVMSHNCDPEQIKVCFFLNIYLFIFYLFYFWHGSWWCTTISDSE